ncbi:MAG: hypothetical protein H7Y14_14250 [Burkholderiales bacterium]|nr:hypothetical protein [Burkholderiales bacterium]
MRIASMLALLALAACAAPEPTAVSTSTPAPSVGPSPATQSHAEDLLAYLGRLRTMNESALGAEAARMKRDASDVARVKGALAMTLSSQSDEGDILELVDPVTRRPNVDRDVRAMATLVHAMATERRRLKQRVAATAGELREERRATESQKQRAEALQQKLDALTELERSLAQREAQSR